ncbi:MAG: hypothetical protein HKN51_16160 [Saprospiraceae bacterium]|nr:hypothetical protein [Saprospiraceae bacterium]
MRPGDNTKVYVTAYTSNEIPFMSQALGPISNLVSGMPLLTLMDINRIKISFGAKSIVIDASYAKYLNLDLSIYSN